jgi:hypothetical protein
MIHNQEAPLLRLVDFRWLGRWLALLSRLGGNVGGSRQRSYQQLLKGNKPYGLTKAEAKSQAKKRRF